MNATGTDRCDLTETKAETPLELGVKFGVRQADDARTVAHNGVAFQRQDRERPGGEKVLLGPPAMIALVRDGGDNRRLLIAKAVAGDSRALADSRTRAVGGNEKSRSTRFTVGEAHVDTVGPNLEIGNCRRL